MKRPQNRQYRTLSIDTDTHRRMPDADVTIGIMATGPDVSKLLTMDDVATLANVRRRTVVDWVAKKWLRPAVENYKRPGVAGAGINLFHPDDVGELLRKRINARSEVLSPAAPGPVVRMGMGSSIAPLLRTIEQQQQPSTALPPDRKRYLTLREASEYTGLGKRYVQEHATGWPIGPRGAMVYRRADLDEL